MVIHTRGMPIDSSYMLHGKPRAYTPLTVRKFDLLVTLGSEFTVAHPAIAQQFQEWLVQSKEDGFKRLQRAMNTDEDRLTWEALATEYNLDEDMSDGWTADAVRDSFIRQAIKDGDAELVTAQDCILWGLQNVGADFMTTIMRVLSILLVDGQDLAKAGYGEEEVLSNFRAELEALDHVEATLLAKRLWPVIKGDFMANPLAPALAGYLSAALSDASQDLQQTS